jgi:hypothetical protein
MVEEEKVCGVASGEKQQCVAAVFVLVVRCWGSDRVRVGNAVEAGRNNNKLLPKQLGKVAASRSERVPDVRPIHPPIAAAAPQCIFTPARDCRVMFRCSKNQ